MSVRAVLAGAAAVALAVALTGNLVGCSKASQPYQSGRLYFAQKLYEKAAEQFKLAIKEDPESGKNYFELAKCYAEMDMNKEAGENFKLAVEKDPRLREDVKTAVQHYWAEHYNRGVELMKDKKYGDAIDEFLEASYLDDTDPRQYINIGVCYANLGEMDTAVKFYERALSLSPEHETARQNLIATFVKQAAKFRKDKEYDRAIEFYEKVMQLYVNDESLDVRTASGAELARRVKGDEKGTGYLFDMAVAYLDRAEAKEDDASLQRANDIFGALYEADPADDDALYYYAYGKMVAEEYAEAISAFGQLLDRSPREPSYYMSMATAYVKAAGGDKDLQMKGVLYFALAKALASEENKLKKSEFRNVSTLEKRLKSKYKSWKDMKKVLDELGVPEDIYAYTQESGGKVEAWFYWTQGKATVFTNGDKTGSIEFAPQEEE